MVDTQKANLHFMALTNLRGVGKVLVIYLMCDQDISREYCMIQIILLHNLEKYVPEM